MLTLKVQSEAGNVTVETESDRLDYSVDGATISAQCDHVYCELPSQEWRPLSTALKNGKPILARCVGIGEDGHPFMPFTIYFDADRDCWCESDEEEIDFDDDGWNGRIEWHPLPE